MQLPFTVDQFLQVFEDYNLAVFPMQVTLYLAAILSVVAILKRMRLASKVAAGVLGFFWLWMGIVYHIIYFSTINKAALVFGVAYIIQGVLFLWYGVVHDKLTFRFQSGVRGSVGSFLMLFGLILYPLIGAVVGHVYPASPTFGLPCPTTIFTFGLLLWTDTKCPKLLLVVPLLWSIVGLSAALTLGMYEDLMLPVAGLVGTVMLVLSRRRYEAVPASR